MPLTPRSKGAGPFPSTGAPGTGLPVPVLHLPPALDRARRLRQPGARRIGAGAGSAREEADRPEPRHRVHLADRAVLDEPRALVRVGHDPEARRALVVVV